MQRRGIAWGASGLVLLAAIGWTATVGAPQDQITVTAYFGPQARATHEKIVRFEPGDTAMTATLRAARVEANAARTFIQSIEGVGNNHERKEYWLYFVNGEAMHVGAAETKLQPGDRVLWFLRRQGSATHVHEKQ